MFSTGNNINNPMKRLEIDLSRGYDAFNINKIEVVTKEWYQLKQTHDSMVTYVISDAAPNEINMYIGDMPIESDHIKAKYFIGINEHNEYEIYERIDNYNGNLMYMVPIKRFNNPQDAINALGSYKIVGTNNKLGLLIHNALATYIQKECGVHECIVSIIAGNGYRDDPRLQYINERAIAFGNRSRDRDIPVLMRRYLHNIANTDPNPLWQWYSRIYDIFVLYEFFEDKKYTEPLPEELDLHEEIDKMMNILKN